ncbi:hypothetical protein ACFY2Q_27635 [Micromonospora sp. NPDC000316]|uniref:hypothetical protein n=1 Tax=Micromonospora sp. NPDC000316 TaxID=3364216 RepID=UPI00368E8115
MFDMVGTGMVGRPRLSEFRSKAESRGELHKMLQRFTRTGSRVTAKRALAATAAIAATILGSQLIKPPAALAAPCSTTSCVYNYSASTVSMTCVGGTGCTTGSRILVSNRKQVAMVCWIDSPPPYTGNYSSSRWFQVFNAPYVGNWVVHSSYVYNQTNVAGC